MDQKVLETLQGSFHAKSTKFPKVPHMTNSGNSEKMHASSSTRKTVVFWLEQSGQGNTFCIKDRHHIKVEGAFGSALVHWATNWWTWASFKPLAGSLGSVLKSCFDHSSLLWLQHVHL